MTPFQAMTSGFLIATIILGCSEDVPTSNDPAVTAIAEIDRSLVQSVTLLEYVRPDGSSITLKESQVQILMEALEKLRSQTPFRNDPESPARFVSPKGYVRITFRNDSTRLLSLAGKIPFLYDEATDLSWRFPFGKQVLAWMDEVKESK